ncbi:MAG TPA: hypothetical protein VII80_00630 [Pseudolabrys sp.]|jgi:hypothetical protein
MRNKIVAHAADPATRPNAVNDVTLEKIADAYRILVQVTQFVSSNILLGGGVGTFPNAQFDQLESLDEHFVQLEQIQKLHVFWDEQEAERNEWVMKADETILAP